MENMKRPAASLLAFLADLHHEIRSPVNTILNMTELASKEEVPSSIRHYFKTIEKSANSLLTLLDDIIELSNYDMDVKAGKQIFGLTYLLEDLKEAIDGSRKAKKTKMAISFDNNIPEWFSGPRGRIRQILTQICNYCIRQLASEEIDIEVKFNKAEKENWLTFSVISQGSCKDNLGPREIIRNPRILICQKLLVELGYNFDVKRHGDAIKFTFSVKVKLLDIPWGEPLFPRPYSCLVSQDGLNSSLVLRRLTGCGFEVVEAEDLSDAEESLTRHVSQSQKGIIIIDWEMVGSGSDQLDWVKSGNAKYPVLYFDIPAIKMMDLSTKVPDELQEDKIGFVMAPSKGRQVISEVARLLRMGEDQLSCILLDDDDKQDDLTITPDELAGMKVLVVEDDRINQRIVVDLLKKFGIKPVVASTGKAASNAVRKRRFHAIFMDINLPDTDGYRLTEEIRKVEGYSDVPIIALTASTKNRSMCMQAGMNYFLSKPYSETKLLKSLIATKGRI